MLDVKEKSEGRTLLGTAKCNGFDVLQIETGNGFIRKLWFSNWGPGPLGSSKLFQGGRKEVADF